MNKTKIKITSNIFFIILIMLLVISLLICIKYNSNYNSNYNSIEKFNIGVVKANQVYNRYRDYIDINYQNKPHIFNLNKYPYKVSDNCFVDKYENCKHHMVDIKNKNINNNTINTICSNISHDSCKFPGMISEHLI